MYLRVRKHDPYIYICCLPETHFRKKRHAQTESEGLEKNIPTKLTSKKARAAVLISEKIDFNTRPIKRDRESHFIILKDINHQEEINIISIHVIYIDVPII